MQGNLHMCRANSVHILKLHIPNHFELTTTQHKNETSCRPCLVSPLPGLMNLYKHWPTWIIRVAYTTYMQAEERLFSQRAMFTMSPSLSHAPSPDHCFGFCIMFRLCIILYYIVLYCIVLCLLQSKTCVCHVCRCYSSRLHTCLSCVYFGCMDPDNHMQVHIKSTGHTFGM